MRFLTVAVTFFLAGCATLIHGTDEKIEFRSTPSTAMVEVNGRPIGTTPTATVLQRGKSYRVRMYRDGFEPYSVTVRNERTLWATLNVFNLLLPGLLIDASTGALYSLEPDRIRAELDTLASQADSGTASRSFSADASGVLGQ